MMNTKSVAALAFAALSFIAAGIFVLPGQPTVHQEELSRPRMVLPVGRYVPAPEAIQVTSEVFVTASAPKKVMPPKAKAVAPAAPVKTYVCHIETLEQGSGQVKACVWQ